MLLRCLRGTLVLAVLVVPWRVTFAVDAPCFLVFHFDAVSACVFEAALAEGRLPNIVRAFEGGTYRHAVTLFPASTPMIYPRLHTGECNASGAAVGFGGFDRARDRPIHEVEVFLGLVEALPRRAVATIVYGVPGMDVLASLAMQNLPGLLERHEVVEFMWFSTDAYGHLYGADAYARSLDRFDAALGQLLPHIDLERTNLILYADHGLTFCSDTVDLEALYEARVGVDLRHAAYPNLYLHDPGAAARVAAALAADGGVDCAFFRAAPGLVASDLVVPVLTRGPDLAHIASDRPIWLHQLYDGVDELTEARPQVREAHAFGVAWRLEDASAVAHLTVSPGEGRPASV